MRIFHINGDQFTELDTLPEALPANGYLWVGSARREFEVNSVLLQAALQRWTGGQLVDLHISDLLNQQLPSHFDYTSLYDLLVFRRLAPGAGTAAAPASNPTTHSTANPTANPAANAAASAALTRIDTHPVGFVEIGRASCRERV